MAEESGQMPASRIARENVERVISRYKFESVERREEGVEHLFQFYAWLERGKELHRQNANQDLLEAICVIEQLTIFSLDLLCQKWEASDVKGLTY